MEQRADTTNKAFRLLLSRVFYHSDLQTPSRSCSQGCDETDRRTTNLSSLSRASPVSLQEVQKLVLVDPVKQYSIMRTNFLRCWNHYLSHVASSGLFAQLQLLYTTPQPFVSVVLDPKWEEGKSTGGTSMAAATADVPQSERGGGLSDVEFWSHLPLNIQNITGHVLLTIRILRSLFRKKKPLVSLRVPPINYWRQKFNKSVFLTQQGGLPPQVSATWRAMWDTQGEEGLPPWVCITEVPWTRRDLIYCVMTARSSGDREDRIRDKRDMWTCRSGSRPSGVDVGGKSKGTKRTKQDSIADAFPSKGSFSKKTKTGATSGTFERRFIHSKDPPHVLEDEPVAPWSARQADLQAHQLSVILSFRKGSGIVTLLPVSKRVARQHHVTSSIVHELSGTKKGNGPSSKEVLVSDARWNPTSSETLESSSCRRPSHGMTRHSIFNHFRLSSF